MPPTIRLTAYIVLLLLLTSQSVIASDNSSLKIVVTIKPLHSLVASLMLGTTEPQLLLNTTQSAHHTNLRPSDYRKLASADIIFWAGAELEMFIPALEKKYRDRTQFISLMLADGVTLLPIRGKHEDTHEKHSESHFNDPHFWLSTRNAKNIVIAVTQALIKADDRNKTLYQHNKTQTLKRIHLLEKELNNRLGNIKTPFITYHDAYQYFEKDYNLNRVTSVNLNEETTPGIRQIRSVKKLITQQQIGCVFYDAPTRPPIINTLISNTNAQAVELDAIGLKLKTGPDLWFDLISDIEKKMILCLRP